MYIMEETNRERIMIYINVFNHEGQRNTDFGPVQSEDAAIEQAVDYSYGNTEYLYTIIVNEEISATSYKEFDLDRK